MSDASPHKTTYFSYIGAFLYCPYNLEQFNRGAAVYAYGKNTDFGASIKIVTNLQKIFKKVVQTADFLIYYLR